MVLESIQDFILVSKGLHNAVVYDVAKRMMNWLGAGGSEDDKYIKDQLKYASTIINHDTKSMGIKKLSDIAKNAKENSNYRNY